MAIEMVWGDAEARTHLGAFDAALADAGLHNYNLVQYSSIIPEDESVTEVETHDQTADTGTPVGVVLAHREASEPGTVAAGLGWHQAAEGGVIYEASGDSAGACRQQLEAGLADARDLRDWHWEADPSFRIVERTVTSVGAVVVAALFGPLPASNHG